MEKDGVTDNYTEKELMHEKITKFKNFIYLWSYNKLYGSIRI